MRDKQKEVISAGTDNTSRTIIDIAKLYGDKYTTLGPADIRVLCYLAKNGASTQMDIGQALNIADARAHIRNLRNVGIPVSDYKLSTGFSQRKKYFIKGL